MRRVAGAAGLFLFAVLSLLTTGCAGSPVTEPTLPTVNFTPKLVIDIRDATLRFSTGPRADDRVRTDPPAVPSGTAVEVVNGDSREHRLQGGTVFDTGIVRPGERTTVVLVNETGEDLRVELTDPTDRAIRGTITVTPAPRPS